MCVLSRRRRERARNLATSSAMDLLARSAAKAARVEDDDAPLVSLAESFPEILNLIGDALAADEDALQPRHLGALSRSCKVVKAAVKDSLAKVKVEHEAARALLRKGGWTVEYIVQWRTTRLYWHRKGLTTADAPALISVLKSEVLVRLEELRLYGNKLGEEGAATFAAAAAAGGLPRLKDLSLASNEIGVAGVQALASAFAGGACRELEHLHLAGNAIGDAGVTALTAALQKGALPNLKTLWLANNSIGDEGVKALMAAAGCGRLARLEELSISINEIGDEGIEALAEALEQGMLPSLKELGVNRAQHPRLKAVCEQRGVALRSV